MELKVLEAYTRDVGRGIIRIDYDTMDDLNVNTGDCVRVRVDVLTAVGRALPLYPSDEGKKITRFDSQIRKNCDAIIGRTIKIEKMDSQPAQSIQISVEDLDIVKVGTGYIRECINDFYLLKGMDITIPYFGRRIEAKVTKTIPSDTAVKINPSTLVVFKDEDTKDVRCPTCGQKVA